MKRLTTYLTIFIEKLYKECKYVNTTQSQTMWIDVPNICNSRREKDFILFDTIERLERKIKIIK